jgi:hypothetical protein
LVKAWTNFADAGGNAHHVRYTFPSRTGIIADSYDIVAQEAISDARERSIDIDERELLQPNYRIERRREP